MTLCRSEKRTVVSVAQFRSCGLGEPKYGFTNPARSTKPDRRSGRCTPQCGPDSSGNLSRALNRNTSQIFQYSQYTFLKDLENDMISVLMKLNPIGDPGYAFSCSILKDLGALHLSNLGPRRASRSPCLSTQFITALVGGSLRFWVYLPLTLPISPDSFVMSCLKW